MTKARDLSKGVFDTDTLVVDAANNRVGIGTDSPAYALAVSNGGGNGLEVRPDFSGNTETRINSYNRSGGNYTTLSFDTGVVTYKQFGTNEVLQLTSGNDIKARAEGGSGLNIDLRQGSAKHWINLNASSASISDSYNVTSITDNAVGQFTVTIANDYNNAHWSSHVNGGIAGSVRIIYGNYQNDQYTGTVKISAYRESPTGYVDPVDFMNTGHGDLA